MGSFCSHVICATLVALLPALYSNAQLITTIAGTGSNIYNGDGIPATAAAVHTPNDVVVDDSGYVYVLDGSNFRLRKIDHTGLIHTIAGCGLPGFHAGDNGPATDAVFESMTNLALDKQGNIYVSDYLARRVRKINTAGIITTIAGNGSTGFSGDGGPATNAELYRPMGIALDKHGNLFIADNANHRIRKVDTSGIITTVAGSGYPFYNGDSVAATAAGLYDPISIAVDTSGNLYISGHGRIRKVDVTGTITTMAGTGAAGYSGDGGPATAALFYCWALKTDKRGNIYFGDINNHVVRKINAAGIITTVAGTGIAGYNGDSILATTAQLNGSFIAATDKLGNVYITDANNNRIRKINNKLTPADVATPENKNAPVSISPNPTSGHFDVSMTYKAGDITTCYVTDVSGRIVLPSQLITNSIISIDLDVVPGLYLVHIVTPAVTITKKVTVQ